MEKFTPRLVDTLISMRAKVVALSLQQVGGQSFGPVAVIKVQSGGEGRHWDAFLDRSRDDIAPTFLAGSNLSLKMRVQHQIGKTWAFVISLFDFSKELASDDAAATPHQGNPAIVQFPIVFFCGRPQQHVALRVGHNFGGIECLTNVFDELGSVRLDDGFGTS